jgi:hypothetical protein
MASLSVQKEKDGKASLSLSFFPWTILLSLTLISKRSGCVARESVGKEIREEEEGTKNEG